MPQSQVAANPWHQEEEDRITNQHTEIKQTHEKHTDQLFLPKRGDRNAKKTEKTQGQNAGQD